MTEINFEEAATFSMRRAVSGISIGNNAFGSCEELKEINLPDSVTEIGWSAFYNCTNLLTINVDNAESNLVLGNKWYPTNQGKSINELVINWKK